MPADLDVIVGAQKYLALVTETTWGELPGSPSYYHSPVDEYSVRARPVNRQGKPHTGQFSHRHNRNVRHTVTGQIVTPLYGWKPTNLSTSLAQAMLEWGFADHETKNLRSKVAEWAEGPNQANKRHLGLRIGQATLSGSYEGISLSLQAEGREEKGQAVVTTAQTLPNDREKLIEFIFEDAELTFNSVVVPMQSFGWNVNRMLKGMYQGTLLNVLRPQGREETFSFTLPKTDDTYDILRRANSADDYAASLKLKGLHNGTGTGGTAWTQVVISFPRLSFVDADEQGGAEDFATQPLTFKVLKPDTSSASSSMAWTEEA